MEAKQTRADIDGLMCCHGNEHVMSLPLSQRTVALLFIYFRSCQTSRASVNPASVSEDVSAAQCNAKLTRFYLFTFTGS